MGKNQLRKTVQYNRTNPEDQEIIEVIEKLDNYNDFTKKAQLEYIRRQRARIIRIKESGGIKHVVS